MRPVAEHLFHGFGRLAYSINKFKSTLLGQISSRASILRDDRTSQRKKRRRAIAQPSSPPSNVDAFNGGEFAQRAGDVLAVRTRSACNAVWIDNVPAALAKPRSLRIVRIDVHCQLKARFWNSLRQIKVRFEGKFLGKIGKCAVNFNGPSPIPLTDRRELERCRTRTAPKKLSICQRIKCLPRKGQLWQLAVASVNVKTDCPEFIVVRLAHLQLCHPIKNFTRIEVAENAAFELQKKWRMNRITQIEQRV